MPELSKARKLLILFLTWFTYIIIGAFIFQAIEGTNENKNGNSGELFKEIKKNITETFNMTDAEFDNFVRQIESATSSSPQGKEWTYVHAMSFIIQLLTTIGYGNITPVTTAGRILCIFYALFGIPLNIWLLQFVGQVVLNGQQILVTRVEKDLLKKNSEQVNFLNEKCALLGVLLLFTLLLICTGIQVALEEWTFLEGFYCYFITFATVGFGDLIPGQSTSGLGLLRIFLIIFGLVAMSNVLNALASCTDILSLLKAIKARCGGTDSSEVEEKENYEVEMSAHDPK
ncbi:potassium channel subfamily K member 17-like [Montipora capricornis]|uniref:potassium channel subfamily K member 17-like n=1 Tax=Montipora capricornis TaxID=246305 RepID=UPI0035F1B7ED